MDDRQRWLEPHAACIGEDGKHIYGGAVSPDGQYVVFTRSLTDGDLETALMSVMRLSDAPIVSGESKFLRAQYPNAKSGPVPHAAGRMGAALDLRRHSGYAMRTAFAVRTRGVRC